MEEVEGRGSIGGRFGNFPFPSGLSLEILGKWWWHKPRTDHIPAWDEVCAGEFPGYTGDSWKSWVIKSRFAQATAHCQGQGLTSTVPHPPWQAAPSIRCERANHWHHFGLVLSVSLPSKAILFFCESLLEYQLRESKNLASPVLCWILNAFYCVWHIV